MTLWKLENGKKTAVTDKTEVDYYHVMSELLWNRGLVQKGTMTPAQYNAAASALVSQGYKVDARELTWTAVVANNKGAVQAASSPSPASPSQSLRPSSSASSGAEATTNRVARDMALWGSGKGSGTRASPLKGRRSGPGR